MIMIGVDGTTSRRSTLETIWLNTRILDSYIVCTVNCTHSVAMGQICRKSAVVYLIQMFVIVILAVVIAEVINLSKTVDNNNEMWLSLLCPTIGYVLPNPKLRRAGNSQSWRTMKTVSFNDVLTIHYTDSHHQFHQRFWENVAIDRCRFHRRIQLFEKNSLSMCIKLVYLTNLCC